MNDSIIDSIMLGVELCLLISILAIVLMMVRTGGDVSNEASATSINVSKSMMGYSISRYDHTTVSGVTLRDLIEQYSKERDVYINSKLCTFGNRDKNVFGNILDTLGDEITADEKIALEGNYVDLSDVNIDSVDRNFNSMYYDDSKFYLGDYMMFQIRIIYNDDDEFEGIYARQVD